MKEVKLPDFCGLLHVSACGQLLKDTLTATTITHPTHLWLNQLCVKPLSSENMQLIKTKT